MGEVINYTTPNDKLLVDGTNKILTIRTGGQAFIALTIISLLIASIYIYKSRQKNSGLNLN